MCIYVYTAYANKRIGIATAVDINIFILIFLWNMNAYMNENIEYTIYTESSIKDILAILSSIPSIFKYALSESVSFNLSNCFDIGD